MSMLDFLSRKKPPQKKSSILSILIGAGIGLALGWIAGLLFAPRPGIETRERISKNAKDVANRIKGTIQAVKGTIDEAVKPKKP